MRKIRTSEWTAELLISDNFFFIIFDNLDVILFSGTSSRDSVANRYTDNKRSRREWVQFPLIKKTITRINFDKATAKTKTTA